MWRGRERFSPIALQTHHNPAALPCHASHTFGTVTIGMILFAAFWNEATAWVQGLFGQGLTSAPALMFGLAVLLTVPLLVGFGAVLVAAARRSERPDPGTTDGAADGPTRAWRAEPVSASLTCDGQAPARLSPDRPMVRIGRQSDNDICIDAETVHRYHALVHRGEDGRYWLLDLSGPDGNGVTVDGARVERRRLHGGETIDVGGIRL